jgi:RNA polymerase sigma factor (TIGR02999 family)
MAAMIDAPEAPADEAAEPLMGAASPAVRALADELVPMFYNELRLMARRVRGKSGAGATLQTTALVNETYFKLRAARGWNDDTHFMSAAALAMPHVLINHAKARLAAKRGAGAERLSLTAADHRATRCSSRSTKR